MLDTVLHKSLPALALAGTFVALAGCGSSYGTPRETAQKRFSLGTSCPDQRIALTEVELPPPAELRGDPERLALWRKNADTRYVRAEGCGKLVIYGCVMEQRSSGAGALVCLPSATAMQDVLLRRFADEMKCPSSSLHAQITSDSWLDVQGCGAHGVYQFDETRQDWVLTPIGSSPPPSTPSPATSTAVPGGG